MALSAWKRIATIIYRSASLGKRTPCSLIRCGIPKMRCSITLLLALNFTVAAIVFAAEPSATLSPETTSSPKVANSL